MWKERVTTDERKPELDMRESRGVRTGEVVLEVKKWWLWTDWTRLTIGGKRALGRGGRYCH